MALSRTPPAPASTRPPSGYTRVSAAQQVSAAIAAILAAAEIAILQALASAVLALLAGTVLQSLITRRLQSAVTAVLMQARADVSAQLSLASRAVRQDVQAVIGADLGPLARLLPLIPAPSLARLAGDLRGADLTAAETVMLAWHRIAQRVSGLDGPMARAAAQSLLDDLAGSGIRAFTDRAGHNWSLSSYGTAASAGAVGKAHADMQLSAYRDAGIGLVIVVRKDPSPPCPRCAPYVGRVLSLEASPGTVTAVGSDGIARTTNVVATVAQARAAGLLHPSCRDSLSPFADGADLSGEIPHGPAWLTAQDRRYRAEQERRRLERAIRTAQRQHAVALSPRARTQATRLVRHLRGTQSAR